MFDTPRRSNTADLLPSDDARGAARPSYSNRWWTLGSVAILVSLASGPATALLAVVLLTLSSPFVYSSHLARSDVLASAMGYGGVALYFAGGLRRRGWPVRRTLGVSRH